MSFAQAQAYCPSQNSRAYLAKITSQIEMSYIQGIMIYAPGTIWVSCLLFKRENQNIQF